MKMTIAIFLMGLLSGCFDENRRPGQSGIQDDAPHGQTSNRWRLIRTLGNDNHEIVVVDKGYEGDFEVYQAAFAESTCVRKALKRQGTGVCRILFWSEDRMAPTSLPMTDEQSSAQTAIWAFNGNTGYKKFLWSCRIVNDPSRCFS